MKLVKQIKICLNETFSKARIGKYLSNNFPIQNGLKQGDDLWPLLFNIALEYAIRKVQESREGLKLNGTHQLLVDAYDVTLLDDNRDIIKKNIETLIDVGKEVGLGVNIQKTKYMLLSHHQNARQNDDIKMVDRCFENVAQFKYSGATVTNQNLIQEEIKRTLK
jgi:hypothetical protein